MRIAAIFSVNENSRINNLSLLLLRVFVGASLFLNHGWEKLAHFSRMMQLGMNPVHIGVLPTLLYATLADGICSLLIIVGLATRAAAFVIVISLSVVFFVMEHALSLLTQHAPAAASAGMPGASAPPPGHAELVFVYLACFLVILIAGPGGISIDRLFAGKKYRARQRQS